MSGGSGSGGGGDKPDAGGMFEGELDLDAWDATFDALTSGPLDAASDPARDPALELSRPSPALAPMVDDEVTSARIPAIPAPRPVAPATTAKASPPPAAIPRQPAGPRDRDETDFSELGFDGPPEALGSLLGQPPELPPLHEVADVAAFEPTGFEEDEVFTSAVRPGVVMPGPEDSAEDEAVAVLPGDVGFASSDATRVAEVPRELLEIDETMDRPAGRARTARPPSEPGDAFDGGGHTRWSARMTSSWPRPAAASARRRGAAARRSCAGARQRRRRSRRPATTSAMISSARARRARLRWRRVDQVADLAQLEQPRAPRGASGRRPRRRRTRRRRRRRGRSLRRHRDRRRRGRRRGQRRAGARGAAGHSHVVRRPVAEELPVDTGGEHVLEIEADEHERRSPPRPLSSSSTPPSIRCSRRARPRPRRRGLLSWTRCRPRSWRPCLRSCRGRARAGRGARPGAGRAPRRRGAGAGRGPARRDLELLEEAPVEVAGSRRRSTPGRSPTIRPPARRSDPAAAGARARVRRGRHRGPRGLGAAACAGRGGRGRRPPAVAAIAPAVEPGPASLAAPAIDGPPICPRPSSVTTCSLELDAVRLPEHSELLTVDDGDQAAALILAVDRELELIEGPAWWRRCGWRAGASTSAWATPSGARQLRGGAARRSPRHRRLPRPASARPRRRRPG
ncbi:MAG: hypothetical protein HS111_37060 [Kofleriaceae bacterium]|nr:hypothetical protein [Kofleriaceae bacterium]